MNKKVQQSIIVHILKAEGTNSIKRIPDKDNIKQPYILANRMTMTLRYQ